MVPRPDVSGGVGVGVGGSGRGAQAAGERHAHRDAVDVASVFAGQVRSDDRFPRTGRDEHRRRAAPGPGRRAPGTWVRPTGGRCRSAPASGGLLRALDVVVADAVDCATTTLRAQPCGRRALAGAGSTAAAPRDTSGRRSVGPLPRWFWSPPGPRGVRAASGVFLPVTIGALTPEVVPRVACGRRRLRGLCGDHIGRGFLQVTVPSSGQRWLCVRTGRTCARTGAPARRSRLGVLLRGLRAAGA